MENKTALKELRNRCINILGTMTSECLTLLRDHPEMERYEEVFDIVAREGIQPWVDMIKKLEKV